MKLNTLANNNNQSTRTLLFNVSKVWRSKFMCWTANIRIENRGHWVHHQYANNKMLLDMHRVQRFFALIDVTQGAILNNCHRCNIHFGHQYSPNKCQSWVKHLPFNTNLQRNLCKCCVLFLPCCLSADTF